MKTLKKVIVQFNLPFVLRLVDSIEKETLPEGYEQYILAKNNIPVMLRFKKQVRENNGGVVVALEDRRGILSYSIVQVWFDYRYFNCNGVNENYKEHREIFIESSLMYVNHFLNLYRNATSSFWISPVAMSEISNFRLVGLYKDGSEDPLNSGTLGTGVGLGLLISPKEDSLLREHLISGHIPDEIQRLAHVVLDLMNKEDYWSAALAIEILFEAKISRILRLAFKSILNLTDPEIDNKFIYPRGYQRSINNLLKTYIKELTGISIEDTSTKINSKYENWQVKACQLRNDITHGKTIHVDKLEAEEAINSVKEFIYEIELLLPDLYTTNIDYKPIFSRNISGIVTRGLVGEFCFE